MDIWKFLGQIRRLVTIASIPDDSSRLNQRQNLLIIVLCLLFLLLRNFQFLFLVLQHSFMSQLLLGIRVFNRLQIYSVCSDSYFQGERRSSFHIVISTRLTNRSFSLDCANCLAFQQTVLVGSLNSFGVKKVYYIFDIAIELGCYSIIRGNALSLEPWGIHIA